MHRVPLIVEPDADDPDFATVMVEATIAGRPRRLVVDTGAARTRLSADDYTSALSPVGSDAYSSTFGRRLAEPIVTVTDLAIGPLRMKSLDVTRSEQGLGQVLGLDVLGQYCCHFRLDAGVMELGVPPGIEFDQTFRPGYRGHIYVDVQWPGVSARACWDSGAGATVVDRGFWLSHPDLFERIGVIAGTDGSGAQEETPLLLMAGPVVGGRAFSGHKAVAVDLSGVNSTLESPMDLIIGYSTIRQADWLFDFPTRRWTLTKLTGGRTER